MPTGKGLRVNAKLTTIPEKKKGSDRAAANSAQTTTDIIDAGKLVTIVSCTNSARTVASAKHERGDTEMVRQVLRTISFGPEVHPHGSRRESEHGNADDEEGEVIPGRNRDDSGFYDLQHQGCRRDQSQAAIKQQPLRSILHPPLQACLRRTPSMHGSVLPCSLPPESPTCAWAMSPCSGCDQLRARDRGLASWRSQSASGESGVTSMASMTSFTPTMPLQPLPLRTSLTPVLSPTSLM